MRRPPRHVLFFALTFAGVSSLAHPVQGVGPPPDCPPPDQPGAFAGLFDLERIRHDDAMTALKNERDQLNSERQVNYNNCRRGDNACLQKVRAEFDPKLVAIQNKETMERSRHRQEERQIGQRQRDCETWARSRGRPK